MMYLFPPDVRGRYQPYVKAAAGAVLLVVGIALGIHLIVVVGVLLLVWAAAIARCRVSGCGCCHDDGAGQPGQ